MHMENGNWLHHTSLGLFHLTLSWWGCLTKLFWREIRTFHSDGTLLHSTALVDLKLIIIQRYRHTLWKAIIWGNDKDFFKCKIHDNAAKETFINANKLTGCLIIQSAQVSTTKPEWEWIVVGRINALSFRINPGDLDLVMMNQVLAFLGIAVFFSLCFREWWHFIVVSRQGCN